MEENQEQNSAAEQLARQAATQAKQQAKQAAKNEAKNLAKKAAIKLVANPYFWIVVGIIAAVVMVSALATYVVQESKKTQIKTANERLTTQSGFFTTGKTIFKNGVYEYKNEFSDEDEEEMNKILKQIGYEANDFTTFEKYVLKKISNATIDDKNNINLDVDLTEYTEEELHLFPKFVEAELKNLYPDLGGNTSDYRDSFQGNVKIQRNGSKLKYISEETFDSYIEANNYEVLNYFTLDANFNLIIASNSAQTASTTSTGNEEYVAGSSNTYNSMYSKTTVPYMDAVSKFAVPYEFFNILLILTEDADFCKDVANLACESEIVIEVYNETTTINTVYEEQGTATVDYNYTYNVKYDYTDVDGNEFKNNYYDYTGYKEEDQKEEFSQTQTIVNTTTTPKIVIKKANTMFWNMEQNYVLENVVEPDSVQEPNTITVDGNNEKIRTDNTLSISEGFIESSLRQDAIDDIMLNNPEIASVNSTNFQQTKSYKDVYLKSKEITATSTDKITKNTYKADETNSILEFKDEGKGGFYDLLISKDYRDKTTENLYELQDRLEEFLRDAVRSADTYISIFEYMKYLISGHGTITNVDSIIDSMKSGLELTPVGGLGGYIVDTRKSAPNLVLTKEQLQEAINKWAGSNPKRLQNLTGVLDTLISGQDKYGVNAVFIIAILQTENGCGTDPNAYLINAGTYNWGSVQGSYNGQSFVNSEGVSWKKYPNYNEATEDIMNLINKNYFGAGLFTVQEISDKYCPDTAKNPKASEEWELSVCSIMTEIYKSAGISISEEIAVSGKDGYTSTYTNKVGLTANQYKQKEGSYANKKMSTYTFAEAGCGYTSVAIVNSMYGVDKTPDQWYKCGDLNSALRAAGLSIKEVGAFNGNAKTVLTSAQQQEVLNHLKTGNAVILYIDSAIAPTIFTNSHHYVALLDISDDGTKVYVSDPNSTQRTGWHSYQTVFSAAVGAKMVSK